MMTKPSKICEHCKKEFRFIRKEQRFCSSKCYHDSTRNRIKRNCNFCNNVIEITPSNTYWKKNYCNNKCRMNYQSTPEGRKEAAKITNERLRNNPSSIPSKKSNSGKRTDLNNTFFRSSWEANLARYYNYANIQWKYEPETFYFSGYKRGSISYTPDFYLPETNQWIEVKGYFNSKDRTKIKRFKQQYPDEFEKLIFMIEKDKGKSYEFIKKLNKLDGLIIYNDLRKYKDFIKFWEEPFVDKDYQKRRHIEQHIWKYISKRDYFVMHYTRLQFTLFKLFNLSYIDKEITYLTNIELNQPSNHKPYIDFAMKYQNIEVNQLVWINRRGWEIYKYIADGSYNVWDEKTGKITVRR